MAVRLQTFVSRLLLVVLIGFIILLLLILSNPERLKTFVIQQIETSLGRKIEVGEATIEFIPRPRLILSHVIIRDTDPSRVFIQTDRFDLTLRATPLLQKHVVVKRMSIDHPQITLRRDRAGQWNFLTTGTSATDSTGLIGNPLNLLLMVQATALTGGVVTVVDDFRADGLRTLDLTDLDLTVTAKPGMPVDVRLVGKIPTGATDSFFSLAGTVTRAASNPAIAPEAHKLSMQFQGALELQQADLRQMMDFFGPRPIPDHLHGMATLKSHLRLFPGVSGYDMVLSDMTASVEELGITGQASMSGIMTSQPTFALTVSATPVSLDELRSRFPAEWLPPDLHRMLLERDIKGRVEVVTATVTGSTTPAPHASVSGEFKIRDGEALLGQNRVPARNLSGTVRLDPDRLRATDITGEYGPLQITTGKLAIVYLDAGPSLELDVSGTMPAADLVAMLAKSASLKPALMELRDMKGQSAVSFQLSGLMNSPEGLTLSKAEIAPQGVSFASPRIKAPVTGVEGRLVYTNSAINFDRVTGRLGGSPFEVHGVITKGEPVLFKDFSLWWQTTADQIGALLGVSDKSKPGIPEPIILAVSLTGPVTAPQVKGVAHLDQLTVSVPGMLQKPAGLPATIEFDATWSRERTLTVSRVDVSMPPVRLSGRGTLRFTPALRVESSWVAGPIPLAELPAGMTLGGLDSGTLEVSLDLKGRGANWKQWALTGWVALTDGRLASKISGHTISDIYLRLQLLKNGGNVKRLEFRVDDSSVRIAGTLRDWQTTPVVTATVESTYLDVELLIPKGERSPARDFLEDLAATSRVTASVDITRAHYKQFRLGELSAHVVIGNELIEVSRISGQLEEGILADSRLLVRLPRRKPAEGELKLRMTGFPSEKVFRLFKDDQRLITGDLTIEATLQGNGKHPRGMANTLNGLVSFRVDQGHIEKGTIVPKILMILDIPNLLQGKIDLSKEGMPFDSFRGGLTIEQGIVTTNNLLIDSPVLKLSAAGSYDIPADQLNLAVVVSPFGSYTKLLQDIPLFGRLLAGERTGFTTAFFDVQGSLKNPQIINQPLKSVGAGLVGLGKLAFDVLKNTLTLPAELFSSEEEKPASPETLAPVITPAPPTSP